MKSLPTKRLLKVNGLNMEYICAGNGSPVIILINGAGGLIEGWFRVFEPLSKLSTVFAYNRLGVGNSDKPTVPQTGEAMVNDLKALLEEANLNPPYLLVGHSLGGLISNLFARKFSHEICGVVLVESAAPEDVSLRSQHQSALQRLILHITDIFSKNHELWETEQIHTTIAQIEQAKPFPQLPLIVVIGGKPAMSWAIPAKVLEARADHQRKLVNLSLKGMQIIAEKSGHFPQIAEPNVVIEAVQKVLEGYKN